MRYKKSELRSNNMALLRRVQRKLDKRNESIKIIPQESSSNDIKLSSFALESVDSFALEPVEKIILAKKTKLDRYNKRGGR